MENPYDNGLIERLLQRLPEWLAIPLISVIIFGIAGKPLLNWLKDVYVGIRESRSIKEELASNREKLEEVTRKVEHCEHDRNALRDERAALEKLATQQEVIITDIRKLLRGLLDSEPEDLRAFREIIRSFLSDIG